MSYFDQEQPIDYTSKYNENIGTISPKTRNHNKLNNSHLTSYHSTNLYTSKSDASDSSNRFGHSQSINQSSLSNNMAFSNNLFSNNVSNRENFNYQINPSLNHQNKNLIQDSLDSGEFTYLYEDTTDSLIVYQTENTPICFSNDSPLSSLSLECLPGPNFTMNYNNNMNKNIQEPELNSSGDSMLDFNMEGTPICFSYDSPLSPLSLNFSSDGDLSPPTLDIINQRINHAKENKIQNNDHDITSMVSNMSIDKCLSTKPSVDRLNKRSDPKFGLLNSDKDGQLVDGFCFVDFNNTQQTLTFNQPELNNERLKPKFLNQRSLVNQSNQITDNQSVVKKSSSDTSIEKLEIGEEKEVEEKAVNFEDGFNDYANEEFYLNECISIGRLSNKTNSDHYMHCSGAQQSHQQNIFDFNCADVSPTAKPDKEACEAPNHLITFDKEQSAYDQLIFDSQPVTHVKPDNSQQKHYQKPVKQIVQMDETATTITNFSIKYASRSQYKIDGEEQQRAESVVFGPVCHLPEDRSYPHQLLDQMPKNSQVVDNSPNQIKQRGLKRIFGLLKKKN